jgi:hypothetical protein
MNTGSLPLVSIVVPAYNCERYVRESLTSILAQTYPNTEVLVMDDCSTDGTPEVVAPFLGRIKYYRQNQNRGIYANANDGIARVSGEYIAIYHADDVYEPRIIEREVEFLRRYDQVGAVFCSAVLIDPEGRTEGHIVLPPEVRGERPLSFSTIFNSLLKYKNKFLMCPSSMVRADVYREVGLYREEIFRNTSDLDMWLRIAQKFSLGVLEENLFRYRYGHGNSAMRYHAARTEPERYFMIMDLLLEKTGPTVATAETLAAYEAHRAEDQLMRTVSAYVVDRMSDARRILREVRLSNLLGSASIERGRLGILFVALQILVRLPRLQIVGRLFSWRWQGKGRRGRGGGKRR